MAIALFKMNAHLQIFNGVALVPEFPELEGAGKGMRHIKLRYRQPVNEQLVRELTLASLQAAAAYARRASQRWG